MKYFMKYRITYIKKDRKYDFITIFNNEKHRDSKIKQYKENSINFKIIKI
jgi:hypothetical protein